MKHKTTKLLCGIMMVPGLMFFTSKICAASTGAFDLGSGSFQLFSGSTITVPLNINATGGDISNFSITLTYDKSVVNIASDNDIVINSTFAGSAKLANANSTTSILSGFNAPPGLTGIVTLASITFTGVGAPGTSTIITVTADPGTFTDSANTPFSPDPSPINTIASIFDTIPNAFTFAAQTGVALSIPIDSNTITVAGIDTPSPISITGGEYSVNGGTFTATTGTVSNGNTVVVRQTSSASFSTKTTATLTIGGVSANFDVTTIAAPAGNAAPVLQSISTQDVLINSLVTFTVKATDTDGDTLAFSLGSNAPTGATINPSNGEFSWTATTLGSFNFDVIVSDGTATDTQSVTINVTTALPASVTSVEEKKDDHCNSVACKRYREFRRDYRSDANRELYFTLKDLQKANPAAFYALQNTYVTYRSLSKAELKILSPKIQSDFKIFKKYNGYRHYRSLREKI